MDNNLQELIKKIKMQLYMNRTSRISVAELFDIWQRDTTSNASFPELTDALKEGGVNVVGEDGISYNGASQEQSQNNNDTLVTPEPKIAPVQKSSNANIAQEGTGSTSVNPSVSMSTRSPETPTNVKPASETTPGYAKEDLSAKIVRYNNISDLQEQREPKTNNIILMDDPLKYKVSDKLEKERLNKQSEKGISNLKDFEKDRMYERIVNETEPSVAQKLGLFQNNPDKKQEEYQYLMSPGNNKPINKTDLEREEIRDFYKPENIGKILNGREFNIDDLEQPNKDTIGASFPGAIDKSKIDALLQASEKLKKLAEMLQGASDYKKDFGDMSRKII